MVSCVIAREHVTIPRRFEPLFIRKTASEHEIVPL